eukprot:5170027-Pleurochrysis_carterae.AAC.1
MTGTASSFIQSRRRPDHLRMFRQLGTNTSHTFGVASTQRSHAGNAPHAALDWEAEFMGRRRGGSQQPSRESNVRAEAAPASLRRRRVAQRQVRHIVSLRSKAKVQLGRTGVKQGDKNGYIANVRMALDTCVRLSPQPQAIFPAKA